MDAVYKAKAKLILGAITDVILETVNEADPMIGAPCGHIYAALASFGIRLDQYQAIESALIKTGQVVKRNHCLFPAKRRSVRTKHAKEHSDA